MSDEKNGELELWQEWCESALCDACLAMTNDGWGKEYLLCDKCRAKYAETMYGEKTNEPT
jgi:hypothetical protein